MWKRIAITGVTAVVIGGAGAAAVAATGATTPTPSASSVSPASDIVTSPSTTTAVKHPGANRLRRAVHATWVTENKKTTRFTTHDAIRGQVTAVSTTSISVRAADNVTETYAINARTKVFTRAPKTTATKAAGSISAVKTGDAVLVGGTGTIGLTAQRVVDVRR